jgi:hypothetical protein
MGLALTAKDFGSVMQNRWHTTWTNPATQGELLADIIEITNVPIMETRPKPQPYDVAVGRQEPETKTGTFDSTTTATVGRSEVTPVMQVEVERSVSPNSASQEDRVMHTHTIGLVVGGVE